MITMHLSFCMHLDMYKTYQALQYEQDLTTGIRVMLQKPTARYQKCGLQTAAPLTTHQYYSSKQGCSTSHIMNY